MEMQTSSNDLYRYDEEFRDTIATVDEKGKRIWLFPKKPGGTHHRWRVVVTVFLLSIFFSGPFLKIGGRPLLLLNIFDTLFLLLIYPTHRWFWYKNQTMVSGLVLILC